MNTELFYDPFEGTRILFNENKREVKIDVASSPFGHHSTYLDLDDVDRLLAVVEHAQEPVLDLAEFFLHACSFAPQGAARAAVAFKIAAPGLAEIVYG